MDDYFLRIEGVNFDDFVFDTNDLSTIRGGGLLLLEAPKMIAEKITGTGNKLESITQGASWGLFRFQADNNAAALEVVEEVRRIVRTDDNYRHATFVVDVLPAEKKEYYPLLREKLSALCKWQQMYSPSIVFPSEVPVTEIPEIEMSGKTQTVTVCQLDHVRPAAHATQKGGGQSGGGDKFGISASVHIRREHGLVSKKKVWYETVTGIKPLPEFVGDFKELTEPGKGQHFGSLNRKMAVMYLDGNSFGSLQRSYCTDEDRQREFDKKIRVEYQNQTLKDLLTEIVDDPAWRADGEKIRLETLLWGGDEVIWVVPAWKGWWMLSRFFQHVKERWKSFDKSPLTLAAGLVFCHHNAPIQRIIRLAKTLGELSKGDRSTNRAAYQVLESFDHAGVDAEAFRRARCPPGITTESLIIDGNTMFSLIEPVQKLKKGMPKRQLHRLVECLYSGGDTAGALSTLLHEIEPDDLKHLNPCLGESNARWLHLLELWDYIAPSYQEEGRHVQN